MAATKYQVMNHAGDFDKDAIVTEQQVVESGADFGFWLATNTIRELDGDGKLVPLPSELEPAAEEPAATPSEVARLVREELAKQQKPATPPSGAQRVAAGSADK